MVAYRYTPYTKINHLIYSIIKASYFARDLLKVLIKTIVLFKKFKWYYTVGLMTIFLFDRFVYQVYVHCTVGFVNTFDAF